MGKIIRKIISILFGVYAGLTSGAGAFYYLETERGITQPSTVAIAIIFFFSLMILCFSAIGAEEFLEKVYNKTDKR